MCCSRACDDPKGRDSDYLWVCACFAESVEGGDARNTSSSCHSGF